MILLDRRSDGKSGGGPISISEKQQQQQWYVAKNSKLKNSYAKIAEKQPYPMIGRYRPRQTEAQHHRRSQTNGAVMIT
jgi:hypothetical protein